MSSKIRILIVDDHPIVLKGLHDLFDVSPDIQPVGEAQNGEEAVEMARRLHPDVILMDLVMPNMDGIQAISEIRQDNPMACLLVLTSFAEDDKVFAAIKAGASGYLLKDAAPQDLLQAVRQVYRGESWLHPSIARKLIREISNPSDLPPSPDPLTEREAEVIALVAQGLSNREISRQLHIGESTVSTHVSNTLQKLHLANRTQVALYVAAHGLPNTKS